MQGLTQIYQPGNPARRDGYAQQTARDHLRYARDPWFGGGRRLVLTTLAPFCLDKGGMQPRSRRGRVMASRVKRAMQRNIKTQERLVALMERFARVVWMGWLVDVYKPYGEWLSARVGSDTLTVCASAGRVLISIDGSKVETCIVGPDGERSKPIALPRYSATLIDDETSPGRWGVQALVGDAHELEVVIERAVYNSPRYRAVMEGAA